MTAAAANASGSIDCYYRSRKSDVGQNHRRVGRSRGDRSPDSRHGDNHRADGSRRESPCNDRRNDAGRLCRTQKMALNSRLLVEIINKPTGNLQLTEASGKNSHLALK